jgi:hypothetical protein
MRRLPEPFLDTNPYRLILAGQADNDFEWFIEETFSASFPARRAAMLKDFANGKYSLLVERPESFSPDRYLLGLGLASRDWGVLRKRHRALRRDEFLADELPAYERYFVLVPCSENCGLPPPDRAPDPPVDSDRSFLQFLRMFLVSPSS